MFYDMRKKEIFTSINNETEVFSKNQGVTEYSGREINNILNELNMQLNKLNVEQFNLTITDPSARSTLFIRNYLKDLYKKLSERYDYILKNKDDFYSIFLCNSSKIKEEMKKIDIEDINLIVDTLKNEFFKVYEEKKKEDRLNDLSKYTEEELKLALILKNKKNEE